MQLLVGSGAILTNQSVGKKKDWLEKVCDPHPLNPQVTNSEIIRREGACGFRGFPKIRYGRGKLREFTPPPDRGSIDPKGTEGEGSWAGDKKSGLD